MSRAPRTIRVLRPAEVDTLVDWAAGEGWNPGLDDAAAFRAADPEGFLGAFVGGEMVAGISAVAYGPDFGFIGLYICRPDMRGRGHGRAVWDAGMARLGARTIGLDGVPEQQANYRRMGFAPAYRTIRYTGRFTPPAPSAGDIQPVTAELRPSVIAFDRDCFPGPRTAFLDRWLAPPRIARALLRDGIVRGYGVARACREGWKIGPLLADGEADAESLFAELAAARDRVHIDVPEPHRGFAAFVQAAGLAPGFETSRMYLGRPPDIAEERVFGVTTLELG